MPVYIDDYEAAFGRMIMCHMMADTREELDAMADKIGVARKWIQLEGRFPHYDICLSKKKQAIKLGAIEISAREMVKKFSPFTEREEIELARIGAKNDGFDDYCEAHQLPYNNECPECSNINMLI